MSPKNLSRKSIVPPDKTTPRSLERRSRRVASFSSARSLSIVESIFSRAALSISTSAAGRRSIFSLISTVRWVTGSKDVKRSTSSPKNSIRTGFSLSPPQKSRMSPRLENCPLPSTTSQCINPSPESFLQSSAGECSSPTLMEMELSRKTALGIVHSSAASGVETIHFASFVRSAESTDSLSRSTS